MKQLGIGLLLAILFCAAAGCGGGERDTTISNDMSPLVVYQYTAAIETYFDIGAPFPAAVGEIITGTFTYDPDAAIQKAPAGVQAKIGNVTLTSNLDSLNDFRISNDSQHVDPDGNVFSSGDLFDWTTHDTSTGASYGVLGIQTVIALQDTTGTVFNDSKIPIQLNLNRFDNAFILIGKEVSGAGTLIFCRALITSLNRLQ